MTGTELLKKTTFVEGHQSFIESDAPTETKNFQKTKHSTFRNLAFKTTQTNIRMQEYNRTQNTITEVNTW